MKLKPASMQESAARLLTLLAAVAVTSNGSAQPASASLSGRAVEDLTGNGISGDDRAIAGRIVHLFRDNGDSVFNAATDTLVRNDTARRDATYSF